MRWFGAGVKDLVSCKLSMDRSCGYNREQLSDFNLRQLKFGATNSSHSGLSKFKKNLIRLDYFHFANNPLFLQDSHKKRKYLRRSWDWSSILSLRKIFKILEGRGRELRQFNPKKDATNTETLIFKILGLNPFYKR